MKKIIFGLSLFILVAVFGYIQIFGLLEFNGVRPDFLLSLLLLALFFRSGYFLFLSLLLFSSALLSFKPGFSPELLVFISLLLVLFFFRRHVSIEKPASFIFIVIFSTFLFYALAGFSFLFSHPGIIFLEAFLNAAFGWLSLVILKNLA